MQTTRNSTLAPSVLRDFFVALILQKQQSKLFSSKSVNNLSLEEGALTLLVRDSEVIEQYYYAMGLAGALLNQSETAGCLSHDDTYPVVYKIMWEDLSRATLPAALSAWLTTDTFRWTDHYQEAPELSYGLVLTDPVSVLDFAVFIAGFSTLKQDNMRAAIDGFEQLKIQCSVLAGESLKALSKDTVSMCEKRAREQASCRL